MVEKGHPTTTREEILSEIEGWKSNPPEGLSWHSKLNNFHYYLPSNDYANEGGKLYGQSLKINGLLNIKNNEIENDYSKSFHSKLFLSQSFKEIFEEIDKTINSIPNISLKRIKSLQHKYREIAKNIRFCQDMPPKEEKRQRKNVDKSMKILKTLYEYTLPVYVELRIKGYNHYDITG